MTHDITLHWYLPSYGDSRAIMSGGHDSGLHIGSRETDLDYLTQLALAAEFNGFESLLTPTGQWCEDAWVTTSALISRTSRIKFLVALRPGLVSPTITAQQATTFQKLSGGRLALNVVIGGEDREQRAYGDYLSKEERYRRGDEYLTVIERLFAGEKVSYSGDYVRLEEASLKERPRVTPPIFFGGSSATGIEVAAKHAEVYLTWGEPVEQAREKIERVRQQAQGNGRTLEYGIRLHVIARETPQEAWDVAQRLLADISPEEVARIQRNLARSQSEGQRRMSALHDQGRGFSAATTARDLEIAPNLWAGVGLIRGGAGTSLVGSYREVAELISAYHRAGFRHFILSGYPHLEETFHVGEGVVPALQELGLEVANHPQATAPAIGSLTGAPAPNQAPLTTAPAR